MEKITKFKAVDGKEFIDKKDCLDYEQLIKDVDLIMSFLPELPKDANCNFANGGGFIQHDKKLLRKTQVQLLKLIKQNVDHKWVQETIDNKDVHPSYVGRLLGDYGIAPLGNAWHRFSCMDKQQREWGQPYYALNPDKGTQIEFKE